MQKKYKVEIMVNHIVWIFADNEEDAKEKAQSKVDELAEMYEFEIHEHDEPLPENY